jgi:hypothetical protein
MREVDLPCLAVVVSEDGTAELMPDLPRRISRDVLATKERLIDELLGKQEHDFEKAFDLINWLESHRFYFSSEFCDKANAFAEKHEKALQKERSMVLHRAKFLPNPQMSDAFLS